MNPIMQLPKQFQEQDIAFSYWMKEAPNDTFVVTAFAVDEAIFGMTRIEVMLSSSDDNIDLQALLDSPGTLTVHHKYMETLRHFSGVVVEAERGDRGHHRTAYRLVLMPSLYRLDHGSDCRVFQTKKVGDIVKELFSEHGIENVTWDIDEGSHDAREYCVQYRESHLGFVERILAEEGIFYYFEHDKEGLLKLIISDKPNVLHDCPGLKEIEYNSLASGSVKGLFCSSLSYREKLRATTVVQRDYTFKNQSTIKSIKNAPLILMVKSMIMSFMIIQVVIRRIVPVKPSPAIS
ncbi:type VI secretion system tip protein TssI/VgrG [Bartonella sp. HY038]|uniref:type VI secretion system tip protein TssI/VgrG n=1 Tax=Bartonella sp. HY038 TaxID=2759660 RepID=UPI0015F7D100